MASACIYILFYEILLLGLRSLKCQQPASVNQIIFHVDVLLWSLPGRAHPDSRVVLGEDSSGASNGPPRQVTQVGTGYDMHCHE